MARPPAGATGLGAFLVLASLGLPWSTSESVQIPGFVTPSTCIPTADGTMWCSPGFMSPGWVVGGGTAHGVDVPARVFLVAALLLVAVALYRSARLPLRLAGASALLGVVVTGPALLGGPVAAVVGGLLLLRAARTPAAEATPSALDRSLGEDRGVAPG